jgi:hypothetical protein
VVIRDVLRPLNQPFLGNKETRMNKKPKRTLKGKVVAYEMSYRPREVSKLSNTITMTKARKLEPKLTIEIDGKRYSVLATNAEKSLDDGPNVLDPTPDLCKAITNRLIEENPIESEREFHEYEFWKDGKTKKRYELAEG